MYCSQISFTFEWYIAQINNSKSHDYASQHGKF